MLNPIKRYLPERHFMRGPDPKWLEKHGGEIDCADAILYHDQLANISSQPCLFNLREPGHGTSRSTPPYGI